MRSSVVGLVSLIIGFTSATLYHAHAGTPPVTRPNIGDTVVTTMPKPIELGNDLITIPMGTMGVVVDTTSDGAKVQFDGNWQGWGDVRVWIVSENLKHFAP